MKQILCFLCLTFLLFGCKPSNPDPAGHWEGNITLPGMQLVIRVDLQKNAAEGWQGTIDIPVQGVRNFKLTGTTVQGDQVAFRMAGIPGEPKFSGKVGRTGKDISGDFNQGGQTFPFKIERKPKPPVDATAETPSKGIPGKGLVGFWQGSLKPMAGTELRLLLEITNSPENKLQGVLVSMDQANARVPMTAVTLDKNMVHLEIKTISSVFDGDLSEDGADIEGDWQQLGRGTPITFMRLEKPPKLATP